MGKEIIWTRQSDEHLDVVLKYLHYERSPRAAEKFWSEVQEILDKIVKGVNSGRVSPKDETVHFFVLRDRWRLYFRINSEDKVSILAFHDTKQHPDKDPFR